MCGIAGIYSRTASPGQPDEELVRRMLRLEQHRGPDGEGIRRRNSLVLGHRRLSILDLSASAAQPMSNEDDSIWVTFNGEIYNYLELRQELLAYAHRFRSASDTEVLLHGYEQWGIDGLLQRLRGMFAFALYDSRQEQQGPEQPFLFLIRDRLGIKPLYYALDEASHKLTFASEVRALVASGAVSSDVDTTALAAFLCVGSIPYPRTCRSGIKCLPPASYMAVNGRGFQIRTYWHLASARDENNSPHEVLAEAVNGHMLADVPVGVFLSGGVDSAAVAALAAQSRTCALSTLTISFTEGGYNEAEDARRFASLIDADHHEIPVSADDFRSRMFQFLAALDQPTADGVNSYFVCQAARELGLKVVLSGLGGDEVFFGYNHYRSLVLKSGALGLYAHAPALLRVMAATAAGALSDLTGKEQWGRFGYGRGRSLNESLYLLVRGFFPPEAVSTLLDLSPPEVNAAVDAVLEPLSLPGENGTIDVDRFQELEIRRYMHDQLLRDSDQFSMAHSVELRVPLIDHKVIEMARVAPLQQRVAREMNKPLLVSAVPGSLLEPIAKRPKKGFVFPFQQWLKQNADELHDFAMQGSLLNRKAVGRCWERFRAGRLHWSRAWSTVVLRAINS
jgi:asparagine synthase (glutamine-hydrolysing)